MEQFSLSGVVRRWARETPSNRVLMDGTRECTWSELDARSSRVARSLMAEGIEPGDRVGFLGRNSVECFEVLFGAAKTRAIDVNLNWRLAAPELADVINDAGIKLIVVAEEFLPTLDAILASTPSVKRLVVIADAAESGAESYERWLVEDASDPGVEAQTDDVVAMLYTSGTTGQPKGVQLTNRNLAPVSVTVPAEFGMDSSSVSLVVLPMFHVGGTGWSMSGLANGGCLRVMDEALPVDILRSIEQDGLTHLLLVPALIQMLLAVPEHATTDFSSLRSVFYGASPISESVLVDALRVFKCGFLQLYGLTEATGAIVLLPPEDHDPNGPRRHLLRAAGKPFRWVEIRIVDPETLEDCPAGVIGEIWARSDQNTIGYWQRPDETAALLPGDGWLRTGDAGYLDEDGYLFLKDRVKDMIVSGGENVYAAEVENVVMAHADVADVAVIGVPDERWGEAVKAVVVPRDGAALTQEALIAHCRAQLAGYKCPKSVDFVEVLPRNPTGKILKYVLREPYWGGADRQIN